MSSVKLQTVDKKEIIKALEEELIRRVEKRPYFWNGEWRCPYIWGKECCAGRPENIENCICYVGKHGIECAVNEEVDLCIKEMKYWI